MKNRNTLIAMAASIFIASCQNSSKINKTENEQTVVKDTMDTNVPQEIAFTLIRNYFVKNTVKGIEQAKIERERLVAEELEKNPNNVKLYKE